MVAAPIDLDVLKDDLGIADATHDAWLQRRVDAIWQRIETYTHRRLRAPPATFVDDWGAGAVAPYPVPMPLYPWPQRWPAPFAYLRQFPVVSIEAYEVNGEEGDETLIRFDSATGKLVSLDGATYPSDLTAALLSGAGSITYTAGWAELPGDLYEVVLGAMGPLYAARVAQAAGGFSGATISSVDIADTGSISLSAPANFVEGKGDPILGPWTHLLEPYVDLRAAIGSSPFASSTMTDPAS